VYDAKTTGGGSFASTGCTWPKNSTSQDSGCACADGVGATWDTTGATYEAAGVEVDAVALPPGGAGGVSLQPARTSRPSHNEKEMSWQVRARTDEDRCMAPV
jgi:hypothetical protein